MIPTKAIELARASGWKPIYDNHIFAEIALDPSFWQALGKALGWKEEERFYSNGENWAIEAGWIGKARRFYDLILTGQPTDDYWNELLK